MSNKIDQVIEEIIVLLDKATSGDWEYRENEERIADKYGCTVPRSKYDLEFCVLAKNHMSQILDELERLQKTQCDAGCSFVSGGEVRHTKSCVNYPESLTEMKDKLQQQNQIMRQALLDVKNQHGLSGENITWEQCALNAEKIADEAIKKVSEV